MPIITPDTAATAAALLKRLANPARLQVLSALRHGPLTVGDLQRALDAPQPIVSQTLARMRADGLVSCHRSRDDARIMIYAIADPHILPLLDLIGASPT